jgi:hypothetical protein
MRTKITIPFLLLIISVTVVTTATVVTTSTTNSTNTNSVQIVPNISAPPSNFFQEILDYILKGYDWLVGFIQNMLQSTLLKQNPEFAKTYANIIAWLVSLTSIYIILTVIEVSRRFIGYLITAGWILIIILLFFTR